MSSATVIESGIKDIFETTLKGFEDTLKASVKGLEEVVKLWSTGTPNFNGSLEAFQKHSKAVLDRTTPALQKSADEYLKLGEQSYKRGTELLKKAVETDGSVSSVAGATARTQKVWGATLDTVRDNAQAAAQTNVRVVELWADVLSKNFAQVESFVGSFAAAAPTAAKGK